MKTGVIFCAGEYGETLPALPAARLLIAADGGYDRLTQAGLVPDVVIGDMDSVSGTPQAGPELVRLPREKDVTDSWAAVRLALERGCGAIWLLGAAGGREDHTLANFALLAHLSQQGVPCRLFAPDYTAAAVTDGALCLPAAPSGTISVFAFSDRCEGVTIEGLKYTLSHAVLKNSFALGVSNEFIGQPARIAVKRGTLLVLDRTCTL